MKSDVPFYGNCTHFINTFSPESILHILNKFEMFPKLSKYHRVKISYFIMKFEVGNNHSQVNFPRKGQITITNLF